MRTKEVSCDRSCGLFSHTGLAGEDQMASLALQALAEARLRPKAMVILAVQADY